MEPGVDGARYRFDFRSYRRWFRQPLRTSNGVWSERQGIVIRLQDGSGNVGYGEIAPLPEFGTETQAGAIAFCQALPQFLDWPQIERLNLPGTATQFAWASALMQLGPGLEHQPNGGRCLPILPICTLLPTGAPMLRAGRSPGKNKPGRTDTYKWKIGVTDPHQEQEILRRFCAQLDEQSCDQPDDHSGGCRNAQALLPATVRLRLDANGGLTLAQAEQWLALCDDLGIEFLEQPLPPKEFGAMLALSNRYTTPIALDESVANLNQLRACYEQGWRGIFVIKGAIAGSPSDLLDFCLNQNLDVVFSSVFETGIGRRAVLDLARAYDQARPDHATRALGFGVEHWLEADGLDADDPAQIWAQLAPNHPKAQTNAQSDAQSDAQKPRLSDSGEVTG
ncbi:MAG: o-succinylbenzoate synthase [Synechococcales cyanobacterium RU_4_20]|nr:o-succinylbenzoate synthase [Synechococcales cyanobacterium RU_4_20]NJR67483.1 o-succinylbenzoate synthase [Synechococcales cyanobacterium CRU_2_2]